MNESVKRIIDVTSTLVLTRATVTVRNESPSVHTHYQLLFPPEQVGYLSDVWVSTSGSGTLHALSVSSDYKVKLPSPLAANESITLDVRYAAATLHPFPTTVVAFEIPHFRFHDRVHWHSPYPTRAQTTALALPADEVREHHGLLEPFAQDGKRFVLGPYTQVPPEGTESFGVWFANRKALLVADSYVRSYYVEPRGRMHAKEEFQLRHAGVPHKGEWSRVDYARPGGSKYVAVAADVWANLPPDATDVRYKDLIGNVTSSRLKAPTKDKRALQLTFRYPLMGGWRNYFWVSYALLRDRYVRRVDKGEYKLTVGLFPSLNLDLLCEKLSVRVYLPEFAHDIHVETHPSIKLGSSIKKERTTMTVYGRPVVELTGEMLRSKSKHAKMVVIRYRYNDLWKWLMPAIMCIELLAVFAVFVACARSGLQGAQEQGEKDKVKVL